MSETTEQVKHTPDFGKPTPGPWRLSSPRGTAVMPAAIRSTAPIAECLRFRADIEERRANARLIAAAPDLLEACKSALAELDDRYDVEQPIGERAKEYPFNGAGELMRKLRAAIDKAEGR